MSKQKEYTAMSPETARSLLRLEYIAATFSNPSEKTVSDWDAWFEQCYPDGKEFLQDVKAYQAACKKFSRAMEKLRAVAKAAVAKPQEGNYEKIDV